MRITYRVVFPLTIIGLIVAIYGYREYNRGPIKLTAALPDFSLEEKTILSEFEKDESAAGKRYNGKIVLIKGVVKNIEQKDGSKAVVLLLGESGLLSTVRCSIDSTIKVPVIKVQDHIVVKGICVGFFGDDILGSDLILNRCIVEQNKK